MAIVVGMPHCSAMRNCNCIQESGPPDTPALRMVSSLQDDVWRSIAARLSTDDRIRLSTACKSLRVLDVERRGDIDLLKPRSRILEEIAMYSRLWRRRCRLYPPNDPSFATSTLELVRCRRPPRTTVFIQRTCPGALMPHALVGRIDWPTKYGWARVASNVRTLRCQRCGMTVNLSCIGYPAPI